MTISQDNEQTKKDIKISTIHAAKGLEFDHVIVIRATEGVLPDSRANTKEKIDEERKVFYVGCSRAKKTLTITHVESGKRKEKKELSRFVTEII